MLVFRGVSHSLYDFCIFDLHISTAASFAGSLSLYIYIYRHRPYLGLVVFTAHEIPEVWRAFFSQPTRVKRTEIALD